MLRVHSLTDCDRERIWLNRRYFQEFCIAEGASRRDPAVGGHETTHSDGKAPPLGRQAFSRATLRHAGSCFQTTDFWPARRPESCAPGRKADTLLGPIPPGSARPAPGGGGAVEMGGGKNTKPDLHLGLGPPGRRGKYRVLSPRRGCRMRVRMTRGKKTPEFFTLKRENKTCVLSCVFSFPEKTKDGKPGTVFARQLSGTFQNARL